jgi:hypothetical protein
MLWENLFRRIHMSNKGPVFFVPTASGFLQFDETQKLIEYARDQLKSGNSKASISLFIARPVTMDVQVQLQSSDTELYGLLGNQIVPVGNGVTPAPTAVPASPPTTESTDGK